VSPAEKYIKLVGLLDLNVGAYHPSQDEDEKRYADDRLGMHLQRCWPTEEAQDT
jgi:hypothetical protein